MMQLHGYRCESTLLYVVGVGGGDEADSPTLNTGRSCYSSNFATFQLVEKDGMVAIHILCSFRVLTSSSASNYPALRY